MLRQTHPTTFFNCCNGCNDCCSCPNRKTTRSLLGLAALLIFGCFIFALSNVPRPKSAKLLAHTKIYPQQQIILSGRQTSDSSQLNPAYERTKTTVTTTVTETKVTEKITRLPSTFLAYLNRSSKTFNVDVIGAHQPDNITALSIIHYNLDYGLGIMLTSNMTLEYFNNSRVCSPQIVEAPNKFVETKEPGTVLARARSDAQNYVQSDPLKGGLTIVFRTSPEEKSESFRRCLPTVDKCRKSIQDLKVMYMLWDKTSTPISVPDWVEVMYIDSTEAADFEKRLAIDSSLIKTKFVLMSDGDRCPINCKELKAALHYATRHPLFLTASDEVMRGFVPANGAVCYHPGYSIETTKTLAAYPLLTNSMFSRRWLDVLRWVMPLQLQGIVREVRNGEDIVGAWIVCMFMPRGQCFNDDIMDYVRSFRGVSMDLKLGSHQLHNKKNHTDERSAILNMLLTLFAPMHFYPRPISHRL